MLLATSILITTCLIIPAVGVIRNYTGLPFTSAFSQYLGLVALIGMAYCYIIATRIKLVETLFGGLDKSYVFHKWLGLGSLAIIFLHDQIDAEIKILETSWLSGFAKDLGGLGFQGLQVLLLLTVITLIPYALWKFTHKFIGILFILATLHLIWIPKPFELTSPLGLYMLSFCSLGIFSYFYTLTGSFPKLTKYSNRLKGTRLYKVTDKVQSNDVMSFELSPVTTGIRFQAGQFSFISFAHKELKESHPFTISKAPSKDGIIRFSVKSLGDYTQKLPKYLEVGMTTEVSKGYGSFGKKRKEHNEIWIAAGIGITPFIAMAQTLMDNQNKKIVLFYCVYSEKQALHIEELTTLAKQNTQFTVHLCNSSQGERLTLEQIKNTINFDIKTAAISFCGPVKMRKMLQDWFKKESIPAKSFHYEFFEIRTGIGIDPIIQWAITTLLAKFPQIKQLLNKISRY